MDLCVSEWGLDERVCGQVHGRVCAIEEARWTRVCVCVRVEEARWTRVCASGGG